VKIRIAALAVAFTLMASLIPAYSQTYDVSVDESIDVSPPWQYTTTELGLSSYSEEVDVLVANTWDQELTNVRPFYINTADSPGPLSNAEIELAIETGADSWVELLVTKTNDSFPQFIFNGPTSEKPSAFAAACGGSGSTFDGDNEVAFCDMPGGSPPYSTLALTATNGDRVTPGTGDNIDEFDMIFNSYANDVVDRVWIDDNTCAITPDPDLLCIAVHEFGHAYGLGDVYDFYPGLTNCFAFSDEKENPIPTMCKPKRTIVAPDQNGMKQIYSKRTTDTLAETSGWNVEGGDIAIGEVNTATGNDDGPDMLVVFGEDDGTNYKLKAEMQWNINANADGGNGQVVSLQFSTAGEVEDVGAALYDINDNSFLDLVVTYVVENPSNTYSTYYKIWKDLKRSSSATNSVFTFEGTAGGTVISAAADSRGTDVIVWDIDNDGQENLVVFTTIDDASGEETLHYFYAEVETNYSIGSWISGIDGGEVIIGEEGIGATLYDASRDLVIIPHFRTDQIRLQPIEFSGTSIDYDDQMKWGPIDDQNLSEDGVGAGEAFDFAGVGSQDFTEMVYMYIDSNVAYWHTEYDSRLNSHP
jgi:hypothetical protein